MGGLAGTTGNGEAAGLHLALRGKTADELKHTIPCTLHQDAGPYSKRKSAECISFSSMLGVGAEKVTKFLLSTEIKTRRSVPCAVGWSSLLEDWEALAGGELGGFPIAGRADGVVWKFVLLHVKADEECQCKTWGMPHFSSDEPCPYCMANRATRPFTDLQHDATWRRNDILPAEVFCDRLRTPKHPLMALPQVHSLFAYPDIVHCMDCNGVCSVVFWAFWVV